MRALLDYVEVNTDDFKMGVNVAQLRSEPFVNLWGFGKLLRRAHADGVLLAASATNCTTAGDGGGARGGDQSHAPCRPMERKSRGSCHAPKLACAARSWKACNSSVAMCPVARPCFSPPPPAASVFAKHGGLPVVYELADDDVRVGRNFDDAVALGGFPIDSHDARGPSMDGTEHVRRAYGIPYRVLLPRNVDRLLVAGRCISASRKALASARITGTCMAMGQAAGTAAALAARSNRAPRDLDVPQLRATLTQQGAIL